MISSKFLIECWWWNVYIPLEIQRWWIGGWMDGCSTSAAFLGFKVVSKRFQTPAWGRVNAWNWEMTRTLRHLSRAWTSSFPAFFEGCSVQDISSMASWTRKMTNNICSKRPSNTPWKSKQSNLFFSPTTAGRSRRWLRLQHCPEEGIENVNVGIGLQLFRDVQLLARLAQTC